MKKETLTKFVTLSIVLFFGATCFAENPLIQTNYTPDAAPMVYNDTVFIYTGHDEDNATGFTMYNYLLYSSTDLVNWQDHGEVASLKSFNWAPSNGAWAAQCIPRNGKFYYYCSIQLNGIGVLVSNTPYGPFTDPIGKPLITNGEIDPSVFIDDDDQAYLFFGNPTCRYVKLNEDMISYSGSVITLPMNNNRQTGLDSYQEGPWMSKRNDKYYLSWSSTCCPEGIGYAISDKVTGPWEFGGSIMDGNSNSSGNQPGIFDFKGSSYTTGFTNELWYSIQGGRSVRYERRSVNLAKISYDSDGKIPKIPWFGIGNPVPSVPQVGTFNPYDTVQAETICFSKGVRTQACTDKEGGMNVDSIHNGDFIKVKGVDFGAGGANLFEARVASATSGGSIELHIDTTTGPLIGTCAVTGTNGWQTWATKSCSVSGATGVHDLYLKFTGGNGMLFNFNWWKFSATVSIVSSSEAIRGTNKNSVTVTSGAHTTPMLRVNLSHSAGNARVSLFDITGRFLATLFDGQLASSRLLLPLEKMQNISGAYIVKVSLNNSTIVTKTISLR